MPLVTASVLDLVSATEVVGEQLGGSAEGFVKCATELMGVIDDASTDLKPLATESSMQTSTVGTTYFAKSERLPNQPKPSNRFCIFREGGTTIRESSTYRAIVEEGRQEGLIEGRTWMARRFLLRLGAKRFRWPEGKIVSALDRIQDASRLEALGERFLEADVQNWDDVIRGIEADRPADPVRPSRSEDSMSMLDFVRESEMCRDTIWEGRQEGIVEGHLEGARRFVLRLGAKRFGSPDDATAAIMKAIKYMERFESMVDRVLDADIHDWNDLLLLPWTQRSLVADRPSALHRFNQVAEAIWESAIFQVILAEVRQEGMIDGRLDEARRFLLRLGTGQFGPPTTASISAVELIQDLSRCESFADRIFDAEIRSWDDFRRAP